MDFHLIPVIVNLNTFFLISFRVYISSPGISARHACFLSYYKITCLFLALPDFSRQVRCSVRNGSSIIDLSPLFLKSAYYTAEDEDLADQGDSPDFYISLCQPLIPLPGITCPPGSAVCMDPVDGPPVVS